ncbi:hypothetical protein A3H16_04310 [Candidatus Kaiserbacteria bacterium RIFCSPLOWO2_12_FULL_53_8]|uniref:Lipoprotein n=2 Tax=Candidatus Kaiseribacteriota TaxID=1752734 RepID=A0A1F6CX54_9BACT|nr:MAG: hypothetical protein A2851_02555 [Candidatus Kaiserbacteria bacterium RIFCSPHIGHO2_01_FULL_53_29]OGG91120.1 MAG: hypothetical protein A3H16_04310 [Candidatus Kaiserbacteria bacterium RIFCSPLOWO2_12_FULL_53_8]
MKKRHRSFALLIGTGLFVAGFVAVAAASAPRVSFIRTATSTPASALNTRVSAPPLDIAAYNKKLLELGAVATSSPWYAAFLDDTVASTTSPRPRWPVKTVYPNAGAILPFNRVVAYYGNFYSKGMGALGQYPTDVMLQKLASASAQWAAADPSTPVIPAIHYIVVTAQEAPQADGMYRLRMPDSQIDKALELAAQIHGLVFLDFQVGLSTLQKELPQYEKYLAMQNVHLGIDPEFSMKTGAKPGTVIGSFDAADINYAANYLAGLVRANDLTPKILVVHRFTQDMVTHYKQITPLPEVQIVMDMDGWGSQAKKIGTYTNVVAAEPVQFTGFKIFYKNDTLPPSEGIFAPAQVLKLTPQPIYIQYQ